MPCSNRFFRDLSDASSAIQTDMAAGIILIPSLRKTTLIDRHVLYLLAASPELMRRTQMESPSTMARIFLEGSLTIRKRVVGELMIGECICPRDLDEG